MKATFFNLFLAVFLAPLLPGIINRTKAFFAGRKGPPLLQLYFDLFKLWQKRALYSRTVSPLFALAPLIGLIVFLSALCFLPFGRSPSLFSFNGDLVFVAYLFGLARLFMVLAALDTGSSFEGMGASREISFSVFVEPSLFLVFAALAKKTASFSLNGILTVLADLPFWQNPFLLLIFLVLFLILLVENSRLPIDDPNTHLELTMIHEAMILDYTSSDLALIFYTASLKLFFFGALAINLVLPVPSESFWLSEFYYLSGLGLLAVLIGILESVLARFRLKEVFELLLLALCVASFAFLLTLRS
ncbi:MAG: NADH-quinone oxidoreductase subunit H [Parachlamydiales bacterium]|jgi:formate hydrogenlyase subunit 4